MKRYRTPFAVLILFAFANLANAHFLWLQLIPHGDTMESRLFFSEAAHVEGDHIPDAVVEAEIWSFHDDGEKQSVVLAHDEDFDVPCLRTMIPPKSPAVIVTTCRYGNYHGSLLTYYAKSIYVDSMQQLDDFAAVDSQKLDIVPSWKEDQLIVTVVWNKKPQADVELSVTNESGETTQLRTGTDGTVKVAAGEHQVLGMLTHVEDDQDSGEIDGESYQGAQHYATLTLCRGSGNAEDAVGHKSQPASDGDQTADRPFPSLSEPIASFGAAVVDGWLYVYGGHTGTAHSHSHANLSTAFQRLNLDGGKQWESLPMQQPLQGLALVAHGQHVYRIGGLDAKNNPGEQDDLHSVATAARFDTQTHSWEDLPSLPNPRSSHDAIVLDDKLYVVGGWALSGDDEGEWQDAVLVMDLTQNPLEWESVEGVPFQKRALAVAAYDGEIYALCGMDEDSQVDRSVYIFDPQSKKWRKGPRFDGNGMDGFGVSGWGLDCGLFLSGHDGILYRMSDDGEQWNEHGRLAIGRFFHRMMPLADDQLIVIAGASHAGHLADLERVVLAKSAPAKEQLQR